MTAPAVLASCGTPEYCAGWQPITIADETAVYLDAKDRPALEGIVSHYEHGRKFKCW
ncbi:hypothetical protein RCTHUNDERBIRD_5 [Rhodobacter phage RcThunderbird]|nr:hypothetical protein RCTHUNDERBIRD_5 [Rhodobacter phage RcThunderbird]